MECFWMVMAETPGRLPPQVRHCQYTLAVNEAKRLAKNNPGERFFVLAAVGCARIADPVNYETIETDEIPF